MIAALGGIAAVTALYSAVLGVTNATTAALTLLLVVLLVAAVSGLGVAVVTALAAVASFNFFFLPPVGSFTIADPQNWVALGVFLAVSLVASNLSSSARARARDALDRRDELARLFDLSRDVLLTTDGREALPSLARAIALRFDLDYAALCLPRDDGWEVAASVEAGPAPDSAALSRALAGVGRTIEFDARSRTYLGHDGMMLGGRPARVVPLRHGTRVIGLLVAAGRSVEAGTLDALGGVAAIAVERVQFLEDRKAAEMARQSEALKTALLASIGHDLRTPLTAIRVAATNLQATPLADEDRREQGEIVLTEAERLGRLFQNILDMARIDAGGVTFEARRVHPSEIVAAAREQVAHALVSRDVQVSIADDVPVLVDPRLTAAALSQLLENAVEHAPSAEPIAVTARVESGELTIAVADRGPGIASEDLSHLFDRFFQGRSARPRRTGTGMGLSIARGLLAAEGGRVWAANRPGGGSVFTIAVPVDGGSGS